MLPVRSDLQGTSGTDQDHLRMQLPLAHIARPSRWHSGVRFSANGVPYVSATLPPKRTPTAKPELPAPCPQTPRGALARPPQVAPKDPPTKLQAVSKLRASGAPVRALPPLLLGGFLLRRHLFKACTMSMAEWDKKCHIFSLPSRPCRSPGSGGVWVPTPTPDRPLEVVRTPGLEISNASGATARGQGATRVGSPRLYSPTLPPY